MFIYFSVNKLISKTQSGFQPVIPVSTNSFQTTHEVFASFDNGLEVRSVFLKLFDKIWHEQFSN